MDGEDAPCVCYASYVVSSSSFFPSIMAIVIEESESLYSHDITYITPCVVLKKCNIHARHIKVTQVIKPVSFLQMLEIVCLGRFLFIFITT